jgi:squalene-hopene/tetraprenyl-beta-curcumene cyclase
MKLNFKLCESLLSMALLGSLMSGVVAEDLVPSKAPNPSLKKELARAIDRGSNYLLANQSDGGSWSDADYPAISSLALVALQGDPEEHHLEKKVSSLKKGYDYILSSVKPNGGIYRIESLMNYNTAVSVLALVVANNPAYNDVILNARKFVIGGQQDFGEVGTIDNVLDGGVGYGDRYPHSDLSNTVLALEAIYYSQHLVKDAAVKGKNDLNWEAAIQFVQNCQNLPETNKQAWVSGDEANKGGFVYFPGDSKAGEMKLPDGRTALRSYGSISYAGMLSYIYAEMDPNDARVKAVRTWLETNYTLEENPGMGPQGLFYYFYTMSKALSLAGIQELTMADGTKVDWAKDLTLKMLDAQNSNGSFLNENSRWWESDPVLVTAYAVLTLQNLYRSL